MRIHRPALAAVAAAGYAFYEPYRFRLRVVDVPVRPGRPTPTVLHVSDPHLGVDDRRLQAFMESVPELLTEVPDLIVATGDLTESDDGIEPLVAALARMEARLGRFYVLGSHDYIRSGRPGYTKYFVREPRPRRMMPAATKHLEEGLGEKGWVPLTNRTEFVETPPGRIRLAGVDDPYIQRHRTGHIRRAAEDTLAIGVTHAPDVVSEWILNGFDLVLAGHTHAGQVRIPGIGALVTNCSLPNGLAGGLNRVGAGWLHVSPGLGTGRFTPIRFACRPEVTLLRLTAEISRGA